MPRVIAIVSCVSQKNNSPKPARDLYIYDWFVKASQYADNICDEWYIISAKYGMVHPSEIIEPYDTTLKEMTAQQKRSWAENVFVELKSLLQPGVEVVIHAGLDYWNFLSRKL